MTREFHSKRQEVWRKQINWCGSQAIEVAEVRKGPNGSIR